MGHGTTIHFSLRPKYISGYQEHKNNSADPPCASKRQHIRREYEWNNRRKKANIHTQKLKPNVASSHGANSKERKGADSRRLSLA
jgi:hypothetical protein